MARNRPWKPHASTPDLHAETRSLRVEIRTLKSMLSVNAGNPFPIHSNLSVKDIP
ncbi:MAG: hypothetical protein Q7T29_14615 [Gallionella sp.]|nr:hypothetical protein [Gallionella sp.]